MSNPQISTKMRLQFGELNIQESEEPKNMGVAGLVMLSPKSVCR